jgi:hypothetical protein
VYHQLHCVDAIRKWIYRSHWDFSDTTGDENDENDLFDDHHHFNHCIMIMKRIVECQSDVTPALFRDEVSILGLWKTHSPAQKCRRFDLIDDWTQEHTLREHVFD